MSLPLDDQRYVRIPISEVTTPKHGYRVITESWWMAHNDDVFGFKLSKNGRDMTPQCNRSRCCVESLMPEGCKAVYLPVAFWKHW